MRPIFTRFSSDTARDTHLHFSLSLSLSFVFRQNRLPWIVAWTISFMLKYKAILFSFEDDNILLQSTHFFFFSFIMNISNPRWKQTSIVFVQWLNLQFDWQTFSFSQNISKSVKVSFLGLALSLSLSSEILLRDQRTEEDSYRTNLKTDDFEWNTQVNTFLLFKTPAFFSANWLNIQLKEQFY